MFKRRAGRQHDNCPYVRSNNSVIACESQFRCSVPGWKSDLEIIPDDNVCEQSDENSLLKLFLRIISIATNIY